jgi:hypothetical protein
MSIKESYAVYARYYFDSEEPEDCRKGNWKFMGKTSAVSEKQAINNVRFRCMGERSQYKPIAVSSHWENGLEWKAIKRKKKS